MTFEKIDRPYEFLVRWKDGKISGAHVGYETGFVDEKGVGEFIPGKVQPVAIGESKGFPLKDILDQLHVDAISGMDEARSAQKAAEQLATEAKESADKSVSESQAKVTEMLAAVDAATEQLTTQLKSLGEVKAKFAPVEAAEPVK